MMSTVVYDDHCKIYNTDHEKTADVEILDFSPGKRLVVSVERSVKLKLSYDERHHIYVGSMAGMEFTSEGPGSHTITKGYSR